MAKEFLSEKSRVYFGSFLEAPWCSFFTTKDVYVTISPATKLNKNSNAEKNGKISEYELFENHEPYIILVPSMLEFWKREFWIVWAQILTDWSRPFQVVIPTVLLGLLIFALLQKC